MKSIYSSVLSVILLLSFATAIFADIKLRQRVSMGGQTFETTRMIKGARQRTEQKSAAGGAMDFMSQVASIEQCDLRRTIQINDSKKLYFINPFAEESTAQKPAPQTRPTNRQTRQGGTITMTYSVTDTGERKTIFGLTARHLKIVQETESSADACSGAFRSKMEIDGWYADFSAEFNCPVDIPRTPGGQMEKPDCKDRIIFKGNSAAKTGFLLNGTMTMYDQNGSATMTQTTETLELSRAPLAASLFDVPADYKLVSSSQELYSMPSMTDMIRQQEQQQNNNDENRNPSMPSNPGMKSVGLNISYGAEAKVNQAEISQYLQTKLRDNNLNARIGTGGSFDYVLNVEVKKVKESTAGKVGGIFGKVTGVETKAGKTEVELVMTLVKSGATSPVTQSRIAQKFDGAASDAVKAAIDAGLEKILAEIED
jgi:hypothetical protein